MVCIEGDTFEMGSTDGDPWEAPARTVTLSTYFIDRTEVTAHAYRDCVEAGVCELGIPLPGCKWASGGDSVPIDCISWNDALTYCEFKGKRLPSEAEWEYAAGGPDGLTFPWGEEAPSCELAVINESGGVGGGCEEASTAPVGSRSPQGDSPFGLQDMAGNVAEWTGDWWGEYDPDDTHDPAGPEDGLSRVVRGGSWRSSDPSVYRTSHRTAENGQDHNEGTVGVRCAMDGAS